MSAKPSGRLNLPEALNGRFTGLTAATYGAEFAFLERFLLPRMPHQVTNRVFLVDAGQFHKAITLSRGFRRLNRTYATTPIHAARSFHPKFLLLTGPESGRLLIGSGNASLSGYTGAGEAFTVYDWHPDHTEDLGAFTTVRDFLRDLNQGLGIDDLAWRLIEDQLTSAEWLTGEPDTSPVLHNLHEPILDQFAQHIGSQPVTDVIAYAPFHDHGARAMKKLIQQLQPLRLTLLVQPRQTTLDLPALTTVTRPLGGAFSVKEINPPEPYADAFLHAKFILARTAHTDYLLQGSPNLSAVALCDDSQHGNVEMTNLSSGPTGAFDAFLNTMTTTPLPNGLRDVTPAEWGDDTPADDSATVLRNLTWEAPNLSGVISRITEGSDIRVYVNTQQLTPTAVVVATEGDSTHFTMTFGPTEIERLNEAERIDIQIHNDPPMPAYPYRVHELLRLSSTGHRIDLLREAGSLDLDDKEIVEILQELDRIMIVDGRSLWRLAHPHDPLNDQEDDDANVTPIRYEDIDWSLIEAHPIYKGYNATGAKHSTASVTELAILLDSLAGRFRIDAAQPGTTQPQPEGGLGSEPELEDAEALDDAHADDEDTEPTRQSASTRAKRLWRSFVQRYIRGLSDHRFVEQVGPGVVIPSYIAFNHLCRRLRITEQIDPDYLTSAQIQLWTFMWGSPETPGYLASLPVPERQVALDVMNQHEDIPATLAAIDDTYWHAWNQGEDIHPLRDTARTFLANTEWHIDQAGLKQAANATSAPSIDSAEDLLDEIWELAAYAATEDIDRELAASANLRFTDIRWKRETILRNGSPQEHHVLHLPDDFKLTAQVAAELLTTWANLDPENDHYRAVAGRTIALRDGEEDKALLFNRDTGEETQVNLGAADPPSWLQRIDHLNSLLAA